MRVSVIVPVYNVEKTLTRCLNSLKKQTYNVGFITDHTNCFLTEEGYLLLTFSPYDGKLTEAAQKKIRSKGYDLRESGFDLYGYGTTTYVMAELVSPLDL